MSPDPDSGESTREIEQLRCSCGFLATDRESLNEHIGEHRRRAYPLANRRFAASDRAAEARRRASRKRSDSTLPPLSALGLDDDSLRAELDRLEAGAVENVGPTPPPRPVRDLSRWPFVSAAVANDRGSLLGPVNGGHDLIHLGRRGDRIHEWRRVLLLDLIRKRRRDLEEDFEHAGILTEELTTSDLDAIDATMHGVLKQLGHLVLADATDEELDAILEGVAIEDARIDQLSERERDVVDGLARGLSEKEIAAELELGITSVHDVVKALSKRFGAHGQVQLLRCLGLLRSIDTP